jgi:hypothetical protein
MVSTKKSSANKSSANKSSANKSSAKKQPSSIATQPAPAPTSTTASGSVAAVVAAVLPTTPPGDLPPAVGAPATPAGWKRKPVKRRGGARGAHPRQDQVTNADAAANELLKSTTYAEDFGQRVPSAATLGFLMENSAKWRGEWSQAEQYAAYAAQQRAAWEQETLDQMGVFKQAFAFVASREPTVAEKYPATAKYLAAGSTISTRAGKTRKEKAKATAKKVVAAPAAETGAAEQPAATTAPTK